MQFIKKHFNRSTLFYSVAVIGFLMTTGQAKAADVGIGLAFFGLLLAIALRGISNRLGSIDGSLKRIADKIDVQ